MLDAALARLHSVGGGEVVGYEIDKPTYQGLGRYAAMPEVSIKHGDFLDVEGQHDFDVVIANPPFTRNHQLSPQTRSKLKSAAENHGIARGAAGLWVYFLLASLQHLKAGGSLFFVVPGAIEFVDYAEPILAHFCSTFASVELVSIDSAVSWGGKAQERAAILVASGFARGPSAGVQRTRAEALSSLVVAPTRRELPTSSHVLLGSVAKLEIGAVTGANDVFLMSQAQAALGGLPNDILTPTVARARHVQGLSVSRSDLETLSASGERTLLLKPVSLGARGGEVRRWLSRVGPNRRRRTAWFNKRDPWWLVDLGRAPDGVFTYMNHFGPRLALAEPGVAVTNTLHKVIFTSRDLAVQRTICASILTTYSQAHAEYVGRVYGGGVLKFELKDARSLPLLLPASPISAAAFARIDTALRAGAYEVARAIADSEFLPVFFGPRWEDTQRELNAGLMEARSLRMARAGKRGQRV